MPNVSFYIARRYLSSKKKKNVIHWITRISVVGIAVITMSMVILLSAFNGIESVIEKLYTEFDAPITIRPESGKTFIDHDSLREKIKSVKGVDLVSAALEELVVLRKGKVWVNGNLIGVEDDFITMSNLKQHALDNDPVLVDGNGYYGMFGAGLVEKLDAYVYEDPPFEQILMYVPKRNMRMRLGSNPFYSSRISLRSRLNYNKEINQSMALVPLEFAQNLLRYDQEINAYYVSVKKHLDQMSVKTQLQEKLGATFIVKTNREKNEIIFKTSKTEKAIVLVILLFIFILAAFNLIASLTMLFSEKSNDIQTLKALGFDQKGVFNIFFYEGLLIAFKGIIVGFVLGYLICFLQMKFHFLTALNINGAPFPVRFLWADFFKIGLSVSLLSLAFSYFPVRFLVKKNF